MSPILDFLAGMSGVAADTFHIWRDPVTLLLGVFALACLQLFFELVDP